MPTIDHARLTDIVHRVFAAAGSGEEEAAIVAGHLVEANLRGHDSHGIGLVANYLRNLGNGNAAVNQKGHVVSDTGSMIVYDGARGWGQIVAREATLLGIARAKETGVAVVALRNAHHIGRVGTYGEMCAGAGLVSISFVNITDQRPAVAPWRGSDARFGTNPVTVAIPGPTPDRPIIADMATSRIAMGKVRVAHHKGERVRHGTLLDATGRPTTDPAVMFADPHGALLPFGEHKGAGLALICELLGGALAGGATGRAVSDGRRRVLNSMFSILVDPNRLGTAANLAAEMEGFVAYATASPPQPGLERVRTPGEPERETKARRLVDGIPVDSVTWAEIVVAGAKVGLAAERIEALARG
jgi:uncharacterized oxidoreductase